MHLQKNTVVINGRKTAYWEKNTDTQEIIILIHGFPGNHRGLVDMANGLNDYRLILPDLPASGESESLEKHNLEIFAGWLSEFLKRLSIDSAIIIGHSFGARVSLVFASLYPRKVKRLVLITPVVKVNGITAYAGSLYYKVAHFLPRSLQPWWMRNRLYQHISSLVTFKSASITRRRELVAANNKELQHLKPVAHMEIFDEFYKQDLLPIDANMHAKTLVIAGDRDQIAPLSTIKKLAGELRHSKLEIMKGAGHIVVLEQPLATARIIRNWLTVSASQTTQTRGRNQS